MEDYFPWLVLLRAPKLGPVQQRKLLDIFDIPLNILSSTEKELRDLGLNSSTIKYLFEHNDKNLEKDISWLDQPDHYFISIQDARYPALLKEITDPPIGLFVDGNPDVLQTAQLGIVGSRNPTAGGRHCSQSFAKLLTESNLTITSGLALGIDYCAHIGALEAGGNTVAVLGSGLDNVYPARHRKIAENIKSEGALVSEFPITTPPLPEHFPRRNRIISGMSLGVLVVEAAQRSGSLITARYAVEQGRDVFAVPGSIKNPLSKGCHYLIKQGAKLVESVEDIIDELNIPLPIHSSNISENEAIQSDKAGFDADFRKLIDLIPYDPVSVDKLVELSGLTADTVSSMLLILEVHGIVSLSGGLYTRIN